MTRSLSSQVLDLAMAIQQIPGPTFAESKRAAFVQAKFTAEGLQDVGADSVGNVYARLPGLQDSPVLIISAHMDTVFPVSTDLTLHREPERIYGPGIGDNSLGVAGLFGLVWALRERAISAGKEHLLPGDVWLVANVCEEGLGDLKGMRAVVDRFGDRVLGYIILEGMALGQVYHSALNVKRYRITLRTQGGHSWVDFGRPSAIHELAALVTQLTAIPLPHQPRTSLNVGIISGGTSVNTIAAQASLELDLRSESVQTLHRIVQQMEKLVDGVNKPGVAVELVLTGHRPGGKIPATHPLVSLAKKSIEAIGVHPSLSNGSTDANIPLSRGQPAVCIGLTTGGGAHTQNEFINIEPLQHGLVQLVNLVEGAFSAL
jgi:tripeptide aminopeptidase